MHSGMWCVHQIANAVEKLLFPLVFNILIFIHPECPAGLELRPAPRCGAPGTTSILRPANLVKQNITGLTQIKFLHLLHTSYIRKGTLINEVLWETV
jgi:hypothetical protein